MTGIDRLRANPRVEYVDDERSMGNGIIITMKQGWSFDPWQDNRVIGADTVREAQEVVRRAQAFSGPYTE